MILQSKTTDINFDKATVVLENNQLVYTFDLNDLLQSDTFKKALAEQGHDVDLDFKQGQAIVKVGEEIENMDLSFMVTEKNSMESMELMITTEVVGLNDSVEMSFPNFDAFIDMTQLYQ